MSAIETRERLAPPAEQPAPELLPCQCGVDEDGEPEFDHDWQFVRDWEGDPNVINGTRDLLYKVCRSCGTEEDWAGEDDDGEYGDDRYD